MASWKDAPIVTDQQPAWMSAPQVQPAEDAQMTPRQRAAARADAMFVNDIKNLLPGAIRGAGSIGSTLMIPIDAAVDVFRGKAPSLQADRERRSGMDGGLQMLGADPASPGFKLGKVGAEIAGTLGVGGTVAKGLTAVAPKLGSAAPLLQKIAAATESGGMRLGAPAATNVAGKVADLGIRSVGGAINGGLSAGLVDPTQAKAGAIVGGALPLAVTAAGATGRAIRQAVAPRVSPEVATLARRAGELGIDLPIDRITNSKPLNAVAASLNYVPLSGRAATEAKMSSQLNSALSRTVGQESDNVTQALRRASDDLGAKFDDVLRNNAVNVDEKLLGDLADVGNKAADELTPDVAAVINKQIDNIVSKAADGRIDGQAAYNIKRTLDRIGSRNTPEAYHARELKKSLMGALDRSLGPEAAKDFATVRKQYGNMLDLEGIAQNGAEGGVSIGRLANMKNIGNKDLQELADISAQFLKTRESPHGALQRLVIGGTGATAAGTAGLPLLAGGMAAGRGVNMALNSSTLRNMILNSPTGLLGTAPQARGLLGLSPAQVDDLSRYLAKAAPVAATSGR